MFTGLISDVGEVRSVDRRGDTRFTIATSWPLDDVALGASIACNGVCLTVVAHGEGWFAIDASAETLSKSTLARWREGTPINLERSLRLGDELGGHLVYGHVDGIGVVEAVEAEGDSHRWRFAAPDELARFLAPKGSIAVDGVSLTVNEVEDRRGGQTVFGVNIIPHTAAQTTLRLAEADRPGLSVGDAVNLEVDMLARYVARLTDTARQGI
jgi:riboflavin synthase